MANISRRDSIRYITLAGLSTGLLLQCKPGEKEGEHHHHGDETEGFKNLTEYDLNLLKQKFFTDQERESVRQLANLIIPADERSGNAEEAGCVAFIEFLMLDAPLTEPDQIETQQTRMRGGLTWLNLECLKRYDKAFHECSEPEQKAILDDIAYPETAQPQFSQGVAFFNLMRDLVATGFWTSKMGIEDLQYIGNRPNVWNGPPQEWLDRLGVSELG